MKEFQTRLITSIILGLAIATFSIYAGFNWGSILAPIFILSACSGLGYWVLSIWREEAGVNSVAPLVQYFFMVLLSYATIGYLFAPKNLIPVTSLITISFLSPAFLDLIRDFNKIVIKPKEEDKPAEI